MILKSKILIVEDEFIEAMDFKQYLKSFGYDVVDIVSTGKDAIRKATDLEPDLILMDIILKGQMDGIEAAAKIRDNIDIPVIYLTANPEEHIVRRAKLTSPHGYILKPVNKTDLKNTIKLALYKHQLESELKESEKKYRTIFENTGTATAIVDEDMVILELNSEAVKLSGFNREEIIGKKKWSDFMVEDELETIRNYSNKRKTPESAPRQYETKLKNRHGIIYDVLVTVTNIPGSGKKLLSFLDISERKKVDKILKEREEFLSNTLNDMITFVAILKTDGEIIFTNNTPLKLIDKELEDAKGRMFYDMEWWTYSKDSIQKIKDVIELCASGELIEQETQVQTKDGLIWINYSMHPIFDKKSNVEYLIAEGRNITERKKADEELIFNTTLLKAQLDSSIDGILVVDENSEVILYNKSFKENTDIPQHLLDTMDDKKLLNETLKYLKEPESFIKKTEHLYEHKNEKSRDQLKFKDGRVVDRYSSPLLDDSGHYYGRIWYFRDITNQKQMEDALRESEEKYRTLFEEDPDYNILFDLDGVIVDVNKAITTMLGFSKEELIGRKIQELESIPSEDMAYILEKKHLISAGKPIKPFETRTRDKDGNIHWVLTHLTPIMRNNKVTHFLAIATDITELKIAENKIKRSLEEKDILLKEIHHRVKNNLQIISSLLDLQKIYVNEDPTAINVLKGSQNRVISMAMVHEMLYQSKDLNHVNFQDYIENLVTNLFYTYGVKNTRPIINVEPVFMNLETSVPLGLIVSELVSNSLKHAFPDDETGEVMVSLESIDEKYKLMISDDGVGFSEDLDFRNIESSLGLRLVNSLVDQLNGSIELDRSNGTKYTITFKELKYKERI